MEIQFLKGQSIRPYIPHLGRLRMTVFKEYPYLYEGELGTETDYLRTYIDCSESVLIIVKDNDRVVGASTALPLEYETIECQTPFLNANIPINEVFCFGESVLLPEYRGQGLYREFFKQRETAARNYGSKIVAFCAVEREKNDDRQPENYQPLDEIWHYFNYTKHPVLKTKIEWKQIGHKESSLNTMSFWIKTL